MGKKVLMIVTSHDALGDTGQKTGVWLEELAASYYVLSDAGCDVTLGSPQGGRAPLDPASLQEPWLTEAGRRFLDDAAAKAKLGATVHVDGIDTATFDGLYLVGGAGTAWDYPKSAGLTRLVSEAHASDRPIAGVCHGVLGLTEARDAAGRSIVAGRSVTGISNAEEQMVGYDKLVPTLPETRLRELGGRYSAAEPLKAHVVCDGALLTGQNPASAAPLARALLERLGS